VPRFCRRGWPSAPSNIRIGYRKRVSRGWWWMGHIEIRDVVARKESACNLTVIFSLPLGSELAKRLSSAAGMDVIPMSPRQFRVYPSQRVLRTIRDNFIPGLSRPASVVLTVRNWETGAMEDCAAYSVRPSYSRLSTKRAEWWVVPTALPADWA
jgi:hypothetical protein